MKKTRDISKAQFERKLAKYGITIPEFSFMGYVVMPDGVHVSWLNANSNRWRARLAYLLNQLPKHRRE